jgi:hypothetical protein
MTHSQLRRLAVVGTLAVTAIALQGCANPWFMGPSAGGVSFKMSQDGTVSYEDNGRDIQGLRGKIVFPNGAQATIRLDGAKGSTSADNATNQQAALMLALIAQMPKIDPATLAKLAPLLVGAPPIP